MSDLAAAVKDLRMLNGLPPFDGPGNICRSDGHFAASIERKYPRALLDKAKAQIQREDVTWQKVRKDYIRGVERKDASAKKVAFGDS